MIEDDRIKALERELELLKQILELRKQLAACQNPYPWYPPYPYQPPYQPLYYTYPVITCGTTEVKL